jgi:hypothetical protein
MTTFLVVRILLTLSILGSPRATFCVMYLTPYISRQLTGRNRWINFCPLHYNKQVSALIPTLIKIKEGVEASTTRGTTALVYCLINSSLYTGTVHRWWSTPIDGH